MPNLKNSSISSTQLPNPHDLAYEIARRALGIELLDGENAARGGLPYVIRVSRPKTTKERLQLAAAARLLRIPVAILPHKCDSLDDWDRQCEELGLKAR
jgi:hypothetical protein